MGPRAKKVPGQGTFLKLTVNPANKQLRREVGVVSPEKSFIHLFVFSSTTSGLKSSEQNTI